MEELKSICYQLILANLKSFLIYLLIVNVVGFLAMGIDKYKAKKDLWRIPESTLLCLCAMGGGIGTIAGMYLFRHKTKKLRFSVGMPTVLIAEIIFLIYVLVF